LGAATVLPEIAQGDSALATHDNLLAFLATKTTTPNANIPPPNPGGVVRGSINRAPQGDISLPSISRSRNTPLVAFFKTPSFAARATVVTESSKELFSLATQKANQAIAPPSPPQQVQQQQPMIGSATDVRTLSVVKRLDISPSMEARSYAVADKYAAVT